MSDLEFLARAAQVSQRVLEAVTAERDALAAEVATMQPKAEVADRLTKARGSKTITEASKALQINSSALFQFLAETGWSYRRGGIWQAMKRL